MERRQIYQPTAQRLSVYDLVKSQEFAADWIERLYNACPFLDGVLIEDVEIAVGEKEIAHKLGRVPRGVQPVLDDAQAAIVDAYRDGSDQSIPTGPETPIVFNAVDYDTSGNYSTTNGRFTVPHTGFYWVNAHAFSDSTVPAATAIYSLLKTSGGERLRSGYVRLYSWPFSINQHAYAKFTAGQYFDFRILQTSGSSILIKQSKADTRIAIKSDDDIRVVAANNATAKIYSARERTASFWAW